MDNMKVHKSESTTQLMQELGIKPLYNMTYSPDMQPVETIYSKVKQHYLKLRARQLVAESNNMS